MKTHTAPANARIRRAADRGQADHGWLATHHSFSFADYYDPDHMGFRSLRVLNDDHIGPGGGFPTHPHRDMEIFSYVLSGSLAHEDSLGNKRVLRPGDIQVMRAGSGVRHSEFNPSSVESVHLLQIWITPHTRGLDPAYTEWKPVDGLFPPGATLVISPDGRDGSAMIAQDVTVHVVRLAPGSSASHHLAPGRGLWLHIAEGDAWVEGESLAAGDAISFETPGVVEIRAGDQPLNALLFDLA